MGNRRFLRSFLLATFFLVSDYVWCCDIVIQCVTKLARKAVGVTFPPKLIKGF